MLVDNLTFLKIPLENMMILMENFEIHARLEVVLAIDFHLGLKTTIHVNINVSFQSFVYFTLCLMLFCTMYACASCACNAS